MIKTYLDPFQHLYITSLISKGSGGSVLAGTKFALPSSAVIARIGMLAELSTSLCKDDCILVFGEQPSRR